MIVLAQVPGTSSTRYRSPTGPKTTSNPTREQKHQVPVPMLTFGPILQLQLYGLVCPCLQKSEDVNARQAVQSINSSCRRVQWIRVNPSGSSSGGFLGGIFSKVSGSGNNTNLIAQIILRDNGENGRPNPELFVDPLPDSIDNEYCEDDNEGNRPATTANSKQKGQKCLTKEKIGYKLNLKLRRVDKVSLDEATGQIILCAKPVTRDGKKSAPKELLRFVVLSGNSDTPISQDGRNLLAHHFMVISEWERQRRASLSIEDAYESDDEDEDDETNFLARRAQKATHYARRELEMQQTKRDREERKAKLIAESGGLKYTAIAMANRET